MPPSVHGIPIKRPEANPNEERDATATFDSRAAFPTYPIPCFPQDTSTAPQQRSARRGGPQVALRTPEIGTIPPYTLEGLIYGGGVNATSFGTSFNPGVAGARAALNLPLGQFRWQTDLQGERTGNYSSVAGYRSYVAGGSHFDLMVMPGTEFGVFGGLQDAQPTFFGPRNTNYFIGAEARKFSGPFMIGGQFGHFDAIDKPGTLTNAWFGEARAHLSIGRALDFPALERTIISGNVGYGSGTASLTSTGAQTTYWGAQLSHGITNTPFSVFVEYQHFENRVDGLGTVWNENMVVGGVKVLFPGTQTERLWQEPTRPLPYILRTVTNF